jgi:transitional endoplasmic reticulum ATPase
MPTSDVGPGPDPPTPDECASWIAACSGVRLEPARAAAVWAEILHHKWVISERLGRDVGFKVACVDYLESQDPLTTQSGELEALGAQMVSRDVWVSIADSQPPKRIVANRIILPLTEAALASKHGVTPPRTIIFFGPPGTGKTHFVRAIAGALQWWFVEVNPSELEANGANLLGANLKRIMARTRVLQEVVVFIDEFEEIAASREQASRADKSITNEFLKQVPLWKREDGRRLLVCATNHIRQLDAALLRPGRFDCIIPVGALDDPSRRTIFESYLAKTNRGEVDVARLVGQIPHYTPADIEYLFQKVTQIAFERELRQGGDYRLDTAIFEETIALVRGSLTPELIAEFEEDCARFTRY